MLALGIASTRELEARCTLEDVENWLEFYTVEPYGDQRADDRSRAIVSKIHDFAQSQQKLTAKDILPTPRDLYQEYLDRNDPAKVAERAKLVATNIAGWLGVSLGEDTQWQLQ